MVMNVAGESDGPWGVIRADASQFGAFQINRIWGVLSTLPGLGPNHLDLGLTSSSHMAVKSPALPCRIFSAPFQLRLHLCLSDIG